MSRSLRLFVTFALKSAPVVGTRQDEHDLPGEGRPETRIQKTCSACYRA